MYKGYAWQYNFPMPDYSNDSISFDSVYIHNSEHMNMLD